jgi:beta-phosphoglucomutase-like phosphatase (HAD superfamily)
VKTGARPDIYIGAARQLGVDLRNALSLKMRYLGFRSGKVGCSVVAIQSSFTAEKRHFEAEADVVVRQLGL